MSTKDLSNLTSQDKKSERIKYVWPQLLDKIDDLVEVEKKQGYPFHYDQNIGNRSEPKHKRYNALVDELEKYYEKNGHNNALEWVRTNFRKARTKLNSPFAPPEKKKHVPETIHSANNNNVSQNATFNSNSNGSRQQNTRTNIPYEQYAQHLQMAQLIVQVYSGRLTLQQVLNMPFSKIQSLYCQIVQQTNSELHKEIENLKSKLDEITQVNFKQQKNSLQSKNRKLDNTENIMDEPPLKKRKINNGEQSFDNSNTNETAIISTNKNKHIENNEDIELTDEIIFKKEIKTESKNDIPMLENDESSKENMDDISVKFISIVNNNVNVVDLVQADNMGMVVKFCPNCKAPTNRTEKDIKSKCSTMTCIDCWTYWCWKCHTVFDSERHMRCSNCMKINQKSIDCKNKIK